MEVSQMLKNSFIEPEILEFDPKVEQPASYARKVFTAEKEATSAKLYMTALGVYRGYMNGAELDEQLLTPG